jgi:hypothetical protein
LNCRSNWFWILFKALNIILNNIWNYFLEIFWLDKNWLRKFKNLYFFALTIFFTEFHLLTFSLYILLIYNLLYISSFFFYDWWHLAKFLVFIKIKWGRFSIYLLIGDAILLVRGIIGFWSYVWFTIYCFPPSCFAKERIIIWNDRFNIMLIWLLVHSERFSSRKISTKQSFSVILTFNYFGLTPNLIFKIFNIIIFIWKF